MLCISLATMRPLAACAPRGHQQDRSERRAKRINDRFCSGYNEACRGQQRCISWNGKRWVPWNKRPAPGGGVRACSRSNASAHRNGGAPKKHLGGFSRLTGLRGSG